MRLKQSIPIYLLIISHFLFFSDLPAQGVKGKSIRTHTIHLTKKKSSVTGTDSLLCIGFVASAPLDQADPETKAAFDFLSAQKGYRPEYLVLRDLPRKPNMLQKYSLLWFHRQDSALLSRNKIDGKIKEALYSYVENGGNILLSLEAIHYLNMLGFETELLQDSMKSCNDDGYGRKLGFHAFGEHPLFSGLNGGAYIQRPEKDLSIPITGFFGASLPSNGKVIAVDWDYIFVRETSKIVFEYETGKGKVIAVGAYMNFNLPNLNRLHLERFTNNIFGYLTGKFSDQRSSYWDFSTNSVFVCPEKPQNRDHPLYAIPESQEWNVRDDELALKNAEGGKNFWDVAGERLLTMGIEKGGIEELWAHPFMAFRDYEAGIRFKGSDSIIWLGSLIPEIEVHPAYFQRRYHVDDAELIEIIVNDPIEPSAAVHYSFMGQSSGELYVKFKSNLRMMWPLSEKVLGSICHGWDPELNAFAIHDKTGDYACMAGANREPVRNMSGQYEGFAWDDGLKDFRGIPTEKFQVACLAAYSFDGHDQIDFVLSASNEGEKSVFSSFDKAIRNPRVIFESARDRTSEFLSDHLSITTLDSDFNKGYRWAMIGTNRFFVNTPGMGKSLVAGYSTTRTGWDGGQKISGRPGYGWYFGRDGQWSGLAILDYGDYEKVKSVLEFFQKYQDLTGKIFHEASTSGFIHYDAADATPLYILLAGRYFRYTHDTAYLKQSWPYLKKAINYCFSTDTDRDHLIENTNVGHGWVEGGELYGSHATLYLNACWAAALDEAINLAVWAGDRETDSYRAESRELRRIITSDFWNPNGNFFSYGKNRDGKFRNDPTVLPAVPLYFKLAEPDQARYVLKQFAGNGFSTNWGMRIVKDDSRYFNPKGYHYGSVWPLFTGWTALAEYSNGNYTQGFSHNMNNLNIYKNWGLGFVEEVLNGSEYLPSGVCPHQCWSETMVLQPAIEGLLGLDIHSQENKIVLSPRLPADWDSLVVGNIRIDSRLAGFGFHRVDDTYHYTFTTSGSKAIRFDFMPVFPAGTKILKLLCNQKEVPFSTFTTDQHITLFVTFELKDTCRLDVVFENGISVLPLIQEPKPGAHAAGLRIISTKLAGNEYSIEMEGIPGSSGMVSVYINGMGIDRIENGTTQSVIGKIHQIGVAFEPSSDKYSTKKIRIFTKNFTR